MGITPVKTFSLSAGTSSKNLIGPVCEFKHGSIVLAELRVCGLLKIDAQKPWGAKVIGVIEAMH